MSSRASSRALRARVRNRMVKARATLPRKCWLVALSSGTSFRPNCTTSDGVVWARRWNTLFSRRSLTQCRAGWRPSRRAACSTRKRATRPSSRAITSNTPRPIPACSIGC
ncbi:hypothetical protein D3C80_1346470 [compost metagenome]